MKKLGLLILVLAGLIGGLWLLSSCTGTGAPAPAELRGAEQLDASISMSKPANGTHFVAGEQPIVTITLKDQAGKPFNLADGLSQLRLMVAGPQETLDTTTAVKLLKTTADRAQSIHHYIDLRTNKDVQVNGTTLTYKLAAVSDEKPGTYVASVWAMNKAVPLQQAMVVAEFQIGTATVEKQIVEKDKCASCHLGADSGKFYFHHIDPGQPGQPGNWSIDQNAVRNCKTCHNQEGYAAYTSPVDGKTRVTDPIVLRVHGVHNGEELQNPLNNDPKTGVFKNYTGVVFPPMGGAKNCTACHSDDRWKTKPSRLACGACHDQVDWATGKSVVKGGRDHGGGPQANDGACAGCHTPDTGGVMPISVAHKVEQPMDKIDVSLTPPKNGKFYVAGEKPVVTLVIRNDKDQPIDHTKVSESTFSTAVMFVYGPRVNSVPVLTNAAKNGNSKARASVTSSIPARPQAGADNTTRGWTFATGDTFKISVNAGPVQELSFPTGVQTAAQVAAFLNANLKDVVVTANAAGNISILSKIQGANSKFEIYNSPVTAKMGWKTAGRDIIEHGKVVGKTLGVTMEPYVIIGNVSTAGNDLRPRTDPLNYTDPDVTRNVGNITYQLDDVKDLKQGTYMIYAYHIPNGVLAGTGAGPTGQPNAAAKALDISRTGIGFMTFQVGTTTPDKKVATNCTNCHGNTIWHLDEGPIHAEPFDTDYCKACHDYNRSGTGEGQPTLGGTSTSGFFGYGAKPLAARLHGVHRGAYLEHPENIYAGNPNAFSEVIFPQDIRNCSKCHSAETTGTWKTEPNRLACTACHDSEAVNEHAIAMTSNVNKADPWSKDRVENCKTCHGVGKDFAVEKVHNVSNPYKPPYIREPQE
ncbi:MAG: hypothetical protein HY665_06605 [Chloroflexi bacterium]|nr:hypothetical protein [Chloroflexota bacterium]